MSKTVSLNIEIKGSCCKDFKITKSLGMDF